MGIALGSTLYEIEAQQARVLKQVASVTLNRVRGPRNEDMPKKTPSTVDSTEGKKNLTEIEALSYYKYRF
jgi:hypothetical protein